MNRKPWSRRDDEVLRRKYPHMATRKLAVKLRRSISSVSGRAAKYKLNKTAEYLRECQVECGRQIASNPRSIAARIPKGNVPLNKGLRRPGYSIGRGRMAETTFKKGQRPGNYLPVGTVRPNSDGYLRIKVSEESRGKGASDKAWEFVHRRVWEAAHGPIPAGHRIWWKDRDHMNCALENLELLSDREHMARTTVQNLPPQLKEVILLKGRLTRKIGELDDKEQAERFAGSPVRDARGAER